MEAVPRLPMINFELKISTEPASFSQQLKQYISQYYGEDPESYTNEIHKLESLRGGAVRPSIDVEGIQILKKYYCQLHFLKSRFPMEELQQVAVYFSWKDSYSTLVCSIPDIRFELMCIMYNIGALHSKLGALEERTTPDGMKISCTHFQCAAWAFQVLRENFYQMVTYISSIEVTQFMELVCLAQAQECILEKSMMDNRKASIIAKVAVQVVDYYKKAQILLQGGIDENNYSEYIQVGTFKEWVKYLNFKVAYHKCISLLYQGQQAEELQKMGQRVALYQAAAEQLEVARKLSSSMDNKQDISEALAFTSDVVEGKKKAAKNENDFIYHEEVPNKDTFQEIKGASLVKGIPFNISDIEVSGPDIFARLVPMETHEASSLYSEKKAEVLRKFGEVIENKDQKLAEFMSSMQIDFLNEMRQATGIPQEIVDRAAALSAKPNAIQDLITSMTKLSNSYHEVDSLLNEIQELLKEEEDSEKSYQKSMGERPPSIIATDLSREAAKYREAHNKANDSNQTLHKAMVTHVANLKSLSQPLTQLQQQIPSVKIPDHNIDENALKEIEMLMGKVEEMKTQRGVLWAQLRDALHKDDITSVLVTKQANQNVDEIFKRELEKHQPLTTLIEQNTSAQENIIKAFIEAYARFSNTRRHLQNIVTKRQLTINSLISSYDTYEDLLSKATKGIEFYSKLETNVTKLLQRIRSACKVQQEEREQMLSKIPDYKKHEQTTDSNTPKLKDYLDSMKKNPPRTTAAPNYPTSNYAGTGNASDSQIWPPGVRPTPVGSEINDVPMVKYDSSVLPQAVSGLEGYYDQNKTQFISNDTFQYGRNIWNPQMQSEVSSNQFLYNSQHKLPSAVSSSSEVDNLLEKRLSALTTNEKGADVSNVKGSNISASQQFQGFNYTSSHNNPSLSGELLSNASLQPGRIFNQIPNDAASNSFAHATHSQYIPMHYQQTTLPTENKINSPHVENTSNHVYASGYATSQNYQNSGMATVQSGAYMNYGNSFASQMGQPSYTYGTNYGVVPKEPHNYQPNVSPNIAPNQEANTNLKFTEHSNLIGTDNTRLAYQPNAMIPPSQPTQQLSPFSYDPNTCQYDPHQLYKNSSTYPQAYQNLSAGSNTPISAYSTAFSGSVASSGQVQTFGNTSQTSYQLENQNVFPYSNQAHGSLIQSDQLSQYSEGYVGAAGLIGQNQINPSSMYTQATMYCAYNPNNTMSSNGGLTSPQCAQNPYIAETPNTNYAYIPNVHRSIDSSVASPLPKTESSTIDLLSGLEFSISQVPLEPEQKKIDTTHEKEIKQNTQPKIITEHSLSENIQEKKVVAKDARTVSKFSNKFIKIKDLDNQDVKKLFQNEVDRYEKFVEVLSNKTLNGPTTLDVKWKEIQDNQDSEGSKKIISVARCYPMKNRFPDILPYDYSRVTLQTLDDDYVNASFIWDISPFVPPIIITQAPLKSTIVDFWTMIFEQRVEFIMCLLSDNEIGVDVYWPNESERNIIISNMVISLQSISKKNHWTERIITISIPDKKETLTLVHLQFTVWPGSLFPVSPDPFVMYIKEFISLYQQQKHHSNPLVIHCLSGIGRSGVACLLLFAILEVTNNSSTLTDLTSLTNKITSFRKNILRDREHLKFAYQAFLTYMKQTVSNDGDSINLIDTSLQEEKSPMNTAKSDPLNTLDAFWASKRDKK